MDKSSRLDIPIPDQRRMWNRWNAATRERSIGQVSLRQAEVVERWLRALGRTDLDLIDIGCGTGWLCERLRTYGRVVGVDLADNVLHRAASRMPDVRFVSGDFMELELPSCAFDVATALEVLPHVSNQSAFMARTAGLLRPRGMLMLATQNRTVLERCSKIGMPEPGQIRQWVDAQTLYDLLVPHYDVLEMTSILPMGDTGILRLVNSVKLNTMLEIVFSRSALTRAKERLMLGHTIMALLRRKS